MRKTYSLLLGIFICCALIWVVMTFIVELPKEGQRYVQDYIPEDSPEGRIRAGDLDYIKKELLKDPSLIRFYNSYGGLLNLAVKWRQFEIAEFLLEYGEDPNFEDGVEHYYMPLMLAADSGDIKIAELLLQHGAKIDVNLVSGEDWYPTPYMMAAGNNDVEMCHFLIAQGADGAFVLSNGDNALSYALDMQGLVDFSIKADLDFVRFMVENGADPDCVARKTEPQRRNETTPLLRAGKARRRDIYDYLVSVGANPNYKDYFGNTPADYLEGRATPER